MKNVFKNVLLFATCALALASNANATVRVVSSGFLPVHQPVPAGTMVAARIVLSGVVLSDIRFAVITAPAKVSEATEIFHEDGSITATCPDKAQWQEVGSDFKIYPTTYNPEIVTDIVGTTLPSGNIQIDFRILPYGGPTACNNLQAFRLNDIALTLDSEARRIILPLNRRAIRIALPQLR